MTKLQQQLALAREGYKYACNCHTAKLAAYVKLLQDSGKQVATVRQDKNYTAVYTK